MALALAIHAVPAEAGVRGDGDTISADGAKTSRDDGAHSPAPDSPPPSPAAGGPRRAGRGRGDRLPAPIQIYRPGVGTCTINGSSYVLSDATIETPEVVNPCPAAEGSGGAAPRPPPTPLEAAYQAWYWQTKLPSPSLATSPPDGAITGLDLYLSIGGAQTLTYDIPALGYNVHLDVTSVYDVHWGDPRPDTSATGRAVTRNHPTQGGPYPNGDLRHQYIERGTATIEVTQKWTAAWSAGGQSGTIADRLATSATVTIPIQEIQAVLRP
jgi:hypothetical protein